MPGWGEVAVVFLCAGDEGLESASVADEWEGDGC